MARIRTIKPEFFTSEDIVCMPPLARLFYVSLWCEADREGRMEWKPITFKMRYLPGDECDINALAQELTSRGLLILYQAGDKSYAEIPTFSKHQVINNREAASTLPARDKNAKATRAPRVKAEGKEGKEGKGKEHAYSAGFLKFWNTWPASERKQDKKDCGEKWEREGLEDLAETICADVEAKKQTQKWREGFIEMPITYLNNRRWEDKGSEDSTPWHESASGVTKRAAELGLDPQRFDEQWPTFKARVMKAHAAAQLTGKKTA